VGTPTERRLQHDDPVRRRLMAVILAGAAHPITAQEPGGRLA
jgi:hypothetical protein